LEYHGRWAIDLKSVAEAFSATTRALLIVHPNNPTGSYVQPEELASITGLCRAHDVAIVADEVFAEYELRPGAMSEAARMSESSGALTFSLGGFSKSVGLPQLKLGWMAVTGPDAAVANALSRLEFVCDAYLSVSTPVQVAAPQLLREGASIRRQIQARITSNYRRLAELVGQTGACRVLDAEGGWSATVQVPTIEPEEDFVLGLLDRHDVLVHPGYFFDFTAGSHLVMSLLVDETILEEAVTRILRDLRARGADA
jgi:aspartate/methionine/tyrosine aminotransferase